MTTMLTTKRLQELDGRHHLHPFTAYRELAAKGSRIIARAEGVYLHDPEGNRILTAWPACGASRSAMVGAS